MWALASGRATRREWSVTMLVEKNEEHWAYNIHAAKDSNKYSLSLTRFFSASRLQGVQEFPVFIVTTLSRNSRMLYQTPSVRTIRPAIHVLTRCRHDGYKGIHYCTNTRWYPLQ